MIALAFALLAELAPPKPIGDPSKWITSDDYPTDALHKIASGSTTVELVIDADGRVDQCRTTTSSGSSELDATACALIRVRGKFTPGMDARGNRIGGIFRQRVLWVLPPEDTRVPLSSRPEILAVAVDVDRNGSVEQCQVIEGGEMIAQGKPNPCIRFPAGTKVRQAIDDNGEPVPFRIVIRQTTELVAR